MEGCAVNENVALDPKVVLHTATADLFSLVAYLMQTPTADMVANLQQVSLADDLRAIAGELDMAPGHVEELCVRLEGLQRRMADDGNALSSLRIEHTRVFTQPKRPLIWPYEGVFTDDELVRAGEESTEARVFVNPTAGDAERAYKAAGFAVEGYREPADYIVTELEFCAKLHERIAKAVLEGDAEQEAFFVERLELFKRRHADAWIPRFFLRVADTCQHEVYLCAADMAKVLCEVENIVDNAPKPR